MGCFLLESWIGTKIRASEKEFILGIPVKSERKWSLFLRLCLCLFYFFIFFIFSPRSTESILLELKRNRQPFPFPLSQFNFTPPLRS